MIYKILHRNQDQARQTPLKPRGELMCSGRVSSSCSTCGICRVTLVTNPVISHEWGKKCSHMRVEILTDWPLIFTNSLYISGQSWLNFHSNNFVQEIINNKRSCTKSTYHQLWVRFSLILLISLLIIIAK